MWDKTGWDFNFSYTLIRENSSNPKGCQWVQTQSWSWAHWAWISRGINLQPSICKYAGDWLSRKNNFKHLWYSFCSRLITLLVCWCWPEFSIPWCYAWNVISLFLCVWHLSLMQLYLCHILSFIIYLGGGPNFVLLLICLRILVFLYEQYAKLFPQYLL
jgi:hypothetical protein